MADGPFYLVVSHWKAAMALSYFIVRWLDELCECVVLRPNSSMVEIGPQDISTPIETVMCFARRRAPERAHEIEPLVAKLDMTSSRQQRAFYSIFGVSDYHAIDPFDDRANLQWDMNRPLPRGRWPWSPALRQFDVLTNFGTSEHVFDQRQFFANVHDLVRVGGVALHIVPTLGALNHGFFNVHPILFGKLADANGYEIADFSYIDDIGNRTKHCERDTNLPWRTFTAIEAGKLCEFSKTHIAAYQNLLANARSDEGSTVFDYIFVALRKLSDRPFISPSQYDAQGHSHTG